MRKINEGRILLALLILALFSVLLTDRVHKRGIENTYGKKTIKDQDFRNLFYSEKLNQKYDVLSPECRTRLRNVKKEVRYYPVPESTVDKSLTTSCINTWMAERKYGGKRGHEGIDIMAGRNERGIYPVVSMTDGVVTNLGWLEKGGYRAGIMTENGTYYYYAHLDSYANIEEGQEVQAGELIGYMGDSGYGEEGTVGKFAVHLHIGMYFYENGEEVSINPYYVLKELEHKKLKYAYS